MCVCVWGGGGGEGVCGYNKQKRNETNKLKVVCVCVCVCWGGGLVCDVYGNSTCRLEIGRGDSQNYCFGLHLLTCAIQKSQL